MVVKLSGLRNWNVYRDRITTACAVKCRYCTYSIDTCRVCGCTATCIMDSFNLNDFC